MPKEITHFALACELGRALPGDSLFYLPLKAYPNLFLLGAVAPDIPFFYMAGPEHSGVHALSIPFHRNDAKALAPVIRFLGRDFSPPALALAAGVVCHILADTLFHPLVHYYAGMDGIHPGATARHRQFETAMDLHFWGGFRGEIRVSRVVRGVELPRDRLVRLLSALYGADHLPGKNLGLALAWYRGIQYLFTSGCVRRALAWPEAMGKPLPPEITGLAYPVSRPVPLPFFRERVFFKDPCTGQAFSTRISSMVQETLASAMKILDLLSQVRDLGPDSRARVDFILSHPGLPRIRPGLAAAKFWIWHGIEDIIPLVYQGSTMPVD